MAGGAGVGQAPTAMGGGQSPLSTGGGMSGGFGGGQQPNGGEIGNFGYAQPQPLQNPFQPQQQQIDQGFRTQPQIAQRQQIDQGFRTQPQIAQRQQIEQNPEYQGYQTQMQDLSRQMDEYVKKAPMYQQLQDLQGKMRGFQDQYQQPQQPQPFNPYARQMPQQQMPFNKGMPYRQPAYDPNNMLAGEQDYYNRMAQQRQMQPISPNNAGIQSLLQALGYRGS